MQTLRPLLLSLLLALFAAAALAQPADPQPDATAPNIFYGSVPPGGDNAPVLVLIHGLGGTAAFFWTGGNDMYAKAYAAGYRTAFISMSADNTPNTARVAANSTMIATTVPVVQRHYHVTQIVFICHSKGGLDLQYAMASYPALRAATSMVFTLSTPNQGSALADWCFGPGKLIAKALGLFNPGMADLRTVVVQAYRAAFDPIFRQAGIPFHTLAGDNYTGNHSTQITGPVLKRQTGEANDGLVTPSESRLDPAYATDMGTVHFNHYQIGSGSVAFPFIQARLPLP